MTSDDNDTVLSGCQREKADRHANKAELLCSGPSGPTKHSSPS